MEASMKAHVGDEQFPTGWRLAAALFVLAALLTGPLAVIATLANPPARTVAVSAEAYALAEPQGARPRILYSVPPDDGDIGHFAFGYVEFDWDPAAPGGVPGFDSWPPGSPHRP
jgi:hypothetical protein